MSWKTFREWQEFDEIEPIGGRRHDFLTASIVSTLVNLRRNPEKDPIPIEAFLLGWGKKAIAEVKKEKSKGRSWQELKLVGQMMAAMYNSIEDSDQKKRAMRQRTLNKMAMVVR